MKARLALALLLGLAGSNASLALDNAVPVPDCMGTDPNLNENCQEWQAMVADQNNVLAQGGDPMDYGKPDAPLPEALLSKCMAYALNTKHLAPANATAYCNRMEASIRNTRQAQWRARTTGAPPAPRGASAQAGAPPAPMPPRPPRPMPVRNGAQGDPIAANGFRVGVGPIGGSITVPPKCEAACRKALMDALVHSGYAPTTGGNIIYAKAKTPTCDVKCQQAIAADMARVVRQVLATIH